MAGSAVADSDMVGVTDAMSAPDEVACSLEPGLGAASALESADGVASGWAPASSCAGTLTMKASARLPPMSLTQTKYRPVTSRFPAGGCAGRAGGPRRLGLDMFWVTTRTSSESSRRKQTISFARGARALVPPAAHANCPETGTPGWALECVMDA